MYNMGTMNFPLRYGNLKLRFVVDGNLGNINTPADTSTKAKRVPILVRSVIRELCMNSDGTATNTPVTIVANDGVWNLGCTFENILGNNPSRLILIHILG
jgi:hypothetical protein